MTPEAQAAYDEANFTVSRTIEKHAIPWKYFSHGNEVYLVDAHGIRIELFEMLDFCTAYSKLIATSAQFASPVAAPEPSAV